VFYNATRKLVLKGADAVVFVADSEVGKMEENKESLANLRTNLQEYGVALDSLPWVIQYNKRDLPNVYTLEELNAELNPGGKVPFFEAVATKGTGVFETFRGISHLLMEKVTKDLRRSPGAPPPPRPAAPAPEAPAKPNGPPTMAPGRAIAREAAETDEDPNRLDYGREIQLPGTGEVAAAPRVTAAVSAMASTGAARQPEAPRPAAPAPAPAARATETATAAPAGEQIVVPVTLRNGVPREIVLRIVLKVEGD
jgi:pyruvate/2-oxoglutarate dehydrogenase complex dihydrolipoamide acyltransferase (E2) component